MAKAKTSRSKTKPLKNLKAVSEEMILNLPDDSPTVIESDKWAILAAGDVICFAFKDYDSRMALAFKLMSLDKQYTRLVVDSKLIPGSSHAAFTERAKKLIEYSDKVIPGRTGTPMVPASQAMKKDIKPDTPPKRKRKTGKK